MSHTLKFSDLQPGQRVKVTRKWDDGFVQHFWGTYNGADDYIFELLSTPNPRCTQTFEVIE